MLAARLREYSHTDTPDHSGDDKERVVKHRISLIFVSILVGAGVFLGAPRDAPAQTGVTVDQAVVSTWSDMKLKGAPQYAALKLNDAMTSIVVDKTFDSSTSYDDFISSFPGNDCRFYVVDFRFTNDDGAPASQKIIVIWLPDGASTKSKMVYTSVIDRVKLAVHGVGDVLRATSKDDVAYDVVRAQQ
jgi:cofilin